MPRYPEVTRNGYAKTVLVRRFHAIPTSPTTVQYHSCPMCQGRTTHWSWSLDYSARLTVTEVDHYPMGLNQSRRGKISGLCPKHLYGPNHENYTQVRASSRLNPGRFFLDIFECTEGPNGSAMLRNYFNKMRNRLRENETWSWVLGVARNEIGRDRRDDRSTWSREETRTFARIIRARGPREMTDPDDERKFAEYSRVLKNFWRHIEDGQLRQAPQFDWITGTFKEDIPQEGFQSPLTYSQSQRTEQISAMQRQRQRVAALRG